ncbi:lysine-specific demethylase 8-like [Teratosphaeria destructans]|uniref:Lysine-specific demethylase 8-like n=1 Tax=Teratosphaeria destructans TaxID=418781 RepID=A0A9W7SIA0_9PEZI|nr:lysine-specific demethylase 8-like [Teratosphaeria destructans]
MHDPDPSRQLLHLADDIAHHLDCAASEETIQLCGWAPLHIVAIRPQDVLELADAQINAYPYQHVPTHWRRLFEEASLHRAVALLRRHAGSPRGSKRRKLDHAGRSSAEAPDDAEWATEVVAVLERGLLVSGAPGRKDLFQAIFHELRNLLPDDPHDHLPATFPITPPPPLDSPHLISRAPSVLSLQAFQTWLNDGPRPLIIPDVTTHQNETRDPDNPNRREGGSRGLSTSPHTSQAQQIALMHDDHLPHH